MNKVMLAIAFSALAFGPMPVLAQQMTMHSLVSDGSIAHGGGCRKSSPPGQCCHMDNKAGSVHCH
jgi:hypothetical protein